MAHRGLPPHRPQRADFPQRVRQADSPPLLRNLLLVRSEERRVGKECSNRFLSLEYVYFARYIRSGNPFPPVGPVAAPCGIPAVPHLHRYYGFLRPLPIHPSPLRSTLGVTYLPS